MTLSAGGKNDGLLALLEVGSRNVALRDDPNNREQFQAWNPSSDKFAGIFGDGDPPDTNIRIRSGITGEVEETIPIGNEVSHPDWSPRGDRIIFTWVTHHRTSQRPGRGGIAEIREAQGAWGTPIMLIEPENGKNFYTPAFSPDAQFFLYATSDCDPGSNYGPECDADADPTAVIWAMPTGGGARIPLDRLNAPGIEDESTTALTNTFPKWAPFVDELRADGSGSVMWVTFSSRRQYGLRSPVGTGQLIWMAAINPEQVLAGEDGSFAAFALPFQDLTTSNHIAQWAAQIVPSMPDAGMPMDNDGGPGNNDGGPGNNDGGPGANDGGPGTNDGGPGANDGGPGANDAGPGNNDAGPGADDGGDGGLKGPTDAGGVCLNLGDPCDINNDTCCTGGVCRSNGPDIFICRPNF